MRSIRMMPSLAAALIPLALLGCENRLAPPIGGVASSGPPQRGGHVTIASFVNIRSIDPAVAFDEGVDPIQRLLFARLVRISRNGQFEPELAESFHGSPDGLHLTFALRAGARFHDGSELTASDVKRSFERMLHSKTPCPAASFYDHLVGYDEYHAGKTETLTGIRAESDHVVTFDLREPDATFLAVLTLSLAAPVCPSADARYDPTFSLHACGAGPFKLARSSEHEALELVRHDGYVDRNLPYLDRITWLFAVPPTAQRFRFERGQVDLLHDLSIADSSAFRTDPRWLPFGAWNSARSTKGLFMNTEMPPFDNAEVRLAVTAAIDRDAIASLRAGHIVAAHQMVPSGVIGHDPEFHGQTSDPDEALRRMARAGFAYDPSRGLEGYPQTIDYLLPADSFDIQVAEVFQQQLARIGIRIRLKSLSWTAYLAQIGRRRHVRMGTAGWSADFDDPSNFFEPIFASGAIRSDESQNYAFFSNPELDEILSRGRRERDPEVRRALYRRAEEIIRDQAPWAIAYGYRYYDVWQPYLRGYRPHPAAFLDIGFSWVNQDQRRLASTGRGAPPTSLNALALGLVKGARP